MSQYARYIMEREGKEIVENEKGFCTFVIQGESCYIVDLFVEREHRNFGVASAMADEVSVIAKERGCTYLVGSVSPGAMGATDSLKVLLAYGFRLMSSTDNLIMFRKEL